MCGIWALFGASLPQETCLNCINALTNRGPEGTRFEEYGNVQLGFTRLAINGLTDDGMQPMHTNDAIWMCNGEIYNSADIAKALSIKTTSGSDCEIIGHLLDRYTYSHIFSSFDGVFAIVIIDKRNNQAIVARDPFGVRPLFISHGSDRIIVASEIKAFPSDRERVQAFPPGCFMTINLDSLSTDLRRYFHIPNTPSFSLDEQLAVQSIRQALTSAVEKRMMTERPVACLLSGGLDSSLIAALVQQELKKKNLPPVKTFSIGFNNSEDLRYARMVANHIGSDHTDIIMTADDFFAAIPNVIKDIESYDITTVRASVGNWLVAKEISERTDCKVIFNGDGSDEVFGGYLYFFKSPSDHEFERETERLLRDIHYFDVLRSDRCISSHGLEPRTPFLDKEFVRTAKTIHTKLRRPTETQCEKWILRKAFEGTGLLPDEVLWRKKEAFSDGVSNVGEKCWFQECQTRSAEREPDWKDESLKFKYLTPQSAESYYYRKIFTETYGDMKDTTVPYFWMPKWSPETSDPSAKTLNPTTVNTS